MRLAGPLLAMVLTVSSLAFAQPQYQGQDAIRVSVEELVSSGMRYHDRLVIARGELKYGDMADSSNEIYELYGEDKLRFVRIGTGRRSFENLRFMVGFEVEVTGIFFDLSSEPMANRHPVLRYFPGALRTDGGSFDKQYFIAGMSVEKIEELESDLVPETEEEPDIEDPDIQISDLDKVDLRDLVENPDPYMGHRITVLGKFRGNNLYSDLSIKDKRTPRDFVVKVGESAIWVTGRRPRGDGFRLNPKKRRDTGKWLWIVGRPWEYEGLVYLKAEKIELAEDPEDPDLEPVKVVYESEIEKGPPPEVAFTLPLAGERGIPLDSEFKIQFSKDMRSASFNRNIDLLYADDDGIGNPFPNLEVLYDEHTRTLTVRPNKRLEPQKKIHLILYEAIEDDEGLKLPVQAGAADVEPGAAVVLSFTTGRG